MFRRGASALACGVLAAAGLVTDAQAATRYTTTALWAQVGVDGHVGVGATVEASADTAVQQFGVCVRSSSNRNVDYPKQLDVPITTSGTSFAAAQVFSPGTYTYFACLQEGGRWVVAGHVKTFTVGSTSRPSTGSPVGGYPNLALDENFDGTALSDTWAPSWFKGGTMNNVRTSPTNVEVADGEVTLTLDSRSSGALISTNPLDAGNADYPDGGFQFRYGYAEARVRFAGDGPVVHNFPAWWTNGGAPGYTDGEHDVAEGLHRMSSNYHCCSPHVAKNAIIPGTWTNAYHTYGIDRQPGKADIYFDGALVRSYATADGGAPHYLVLNIGHRTGLPNSNVYGAAGALRVDHVRVWTP
jgi:hypothetical protein